MAVLTISIIKRIVVRFAWVLRFDDIIIVSNELVLIQPNFKEEKVPDDQ